MKIKDMAVYFSAFIPRNPRAILTIFRSLKHRDFALYFFGMGISLIGAWVQQVAMGWLVFRLTNSPFMLSLSVFLAQIPILFLSPLTGFLSDRFRRKNILIISQFTLMSASVCLFLLCYFHLETISLILCFSFFFGIVMSVEAPARQSFYSELVPPEDLSNAIALNSTIINGTRFIGPAVGGMIIAKWGEQWCFLLNSVSFAGILISLFLIRTVFHIERKVTTSAITDIREGFEYVLGSVPIKGVILYLISFTFFAVPFPLLLPAYVGKVLGGNSETLGNMMSCIGIGALAAALYLAARKRVIGLGRVIAFSGFILGISLMLFAYNDIIWIAYVISVPFGFALISLAASSNTILQSIVHDEKRGRVMSIFTMAFFGVPPLGTLVQGIVSKYISLQHVTFACGIIGIISALIFEHYRPVIRKHVRRIYADKGIIIPEIAKGLQESGHGHMPSS